MCCHVSSRSKLVWFFILGTSVFVFWNTFRSYNYYTPPIAILPPAFRRNGSAQRNVSAQKNLSISLIIRMSGERDDHKVRFYCNMFKTVVLFWPPSLGKTVVVLDQDIEEDHKFGGLLSSQTHKHFPSYKFDVRYEPLPKDASVLNFRSQLKSAGYNRQLWSSFLFDLYTNDDIVGWLDTDSPFLFPVTKPTIMTDGKVRILGSSCSMDISWVKSWAATTKLAIGLPQVADFMTYFPVYVYRDTFTRCRELILKRFSTDNFEEAFKRFYHTGTGYISPVSVVISYAWYFEKDRYSWNFEICGDLNTYNNRLPEGHKIQPEDVKDVLTMPQTAYHGPLDTVDIYAKTIPMSFCLCQAAAGRRPSMCENHNAFDIIYLLNLFNPDMHAHRRKKPHPCAKSSTEKCLDILKRYIEKIGAEIKANLRRLEWDDFEEVDTLAREVGVTCPAHPVWKR